MRLGYNWYNGAIGAKLGFHDGRMRMRAMGHRWYKPRISQGCGLWPETRADILCVCTASGEANWMGSLTHRFSGSTKDHPWIHRIPRNQSRNVMKWQYQAIAFRRMGVGLGIGWSLVWLEILKMFGRRWHTYGLEYLTSNHTRISSYITPASLVVLLDFFLTWQLELTHLGEQTDSPHRFPPSIRKPKWELDLHLGFLSMNPCSF